MLRLPPFSVFHPSTLDEAIRLLVEHGDAARIMAGGTDLIPNMKHGIEAPRVIIGLSRIPTMREVVVEGNAMRVGALVTIDALARDATVREIFPSLSDAAVSIAGPQLRRMGTLGGNLCLDTRCVFVNQTAFWRSALGMCLKKDGTACHVVKEGRRCVAAASSDTAPVLMSLGATVTLVGSTGERHLSLDDFYVANGLKNQNRNADEIVTHVTIPLPQGRTGAAYEKLRMRGAIDFPELGIAVVVRLGDANDRLEMVEICMTALGSKPVRLRRGLDGMCGRPLDQDAIDALKEAAFQRAHPLSNIAEDPAYRREMVRVLVGRGLLRARDRVVAANRETGSRGA